jgi:signal transduction histidine kinase
LVKSTAGTMGTPVGSRVCFLRRACVWEKRLMRINRANAAAAKAWFHGAVLTALCLLLLQAVRNCCAQTTAPVPGRLVVVLYPEAYNGSPGNTLADQGIRAAFAKGSREPIEIHNEYLEVSRFPEANYQWELAEFLRRKYANRKVDLVIAGLSSAFDFAIQNRERVFPDAPVVFLAVDEQEVKKRTVAPEIIGAPIRMELADSLGLALRLHPRTETVFVIVGKSKFDAYWEAESRKTFGVYADKVKFVYLSGLTVRELLLQAKTFPDRSIAYYLHVFEDGDGFVQIPAEVLAQVAAVANVPIYSHVDSYIGRGVVGGRVFSFEMAGRRAAEIGLRVFAGERPQEIGIQPTLETEFAFDGRQLRRWNISEASLPAGSIVRYQEPSVWELYKWRIAAVVAFVILQMLLIVRLLGQRVRLARAKSESNESQRELQELTGKLFGAQETERRRLASELHDDFGQSLALLSVEIDLLRRTMLRQESPGGGADSRPAESNGQSESLIDAMSTQVKQLSSSIHDLSHQLHPLKLEQLGLVAALGGLCNELSRAEVVRIAFIHEDVPASISQSSAVCLYRIAQEAVRNVIKHSGAQHAVVELRGTDAAIQMRIQDDGKGFELNSPASQGGLGLVSMRERLREVHGSLAITAQPSQGTQIDVRVPLDNTSNNIIMNLNGRETRQPAATAAQLITADNANRSRMQEARPDESLADALGYNI